MIRDRLATSIAAEPAELVLGRIAGAIDDHLRAQYKAARKVALETLESERYLQLLDDLDALVADPPLTEEAADLKPKKTPDLLVSLLKHDWKRIQKAVDRMRAAELGGTDAAASALSVDAADAADAAVELERHEVRKSAKRLRYAGESAVPVLGDQATALASSAESVQEVLGLYQDSSSRAKCCANSPYRCTSTAATPSPSAASTPWNKSSRRPGHRHLRHRLARNLPLLTLFVKLSQSVDTGSHIENRWRARSGSRHRPTRVSASSRSCSCGSSGDSVRRRGSQSPRLVRRESFAGYCLGRAGLCPD